MRDVGVGIRLLSVAEFKDIATVVVIKDIMLEYARVEDKDRCDRRSFLILEVVFRKAVPGPQQARVYALTEDQAREAPGGVITDPNKTKAGNKYEVKPQYEELSKQIDMQHAINQCYECMRAAKENHSARPVYQQAKYIRSPLYHGQSTGKSSVRDHRARQPITARMIALDWCTTHLLASSNVARVMNQIYQSPICMHALATKTELKSQELLTRSSKESTAESAHETSNFTNTQKLLGFLNSLSLASKLVSMGRASLKESSATKNVKNRGWNRREMAIDSDGEQ
ncbi:hypothetical protein F511_32601 [Dorcoceras hygrometricum]|uniref:Uncharacterized protein n=1 Tax=Dorcoceras hygrometricum TaxID=472368 RepID=A0A2Z7D533_9LAMI|nr:hypothetical protein F511_32601 [Dorcoceras hygrometricum]